MGTFSPAEVIQKIGTAGKAKCELGGFNTLVRAFLAGTYIAIGAALATVGSTGVADVLGPGIAQIVLGALFPIGLILVVLTGAELFTGDAMFAPMAIAQGHIKMSGLIKLWILVYIGNLIGSLFMALMLSLGPYVSWSAAGAATVTAFGTRAIAIATAKVSYTGALGFLSCFLKGIVCNWLVCLALFIGIAAQEVVSKIFAIWLPIFCFVACGFEHCIANMFFISAGIMTNLVTGVGLTEVLNWGTMWTNNLIWSTLGNIVGAVILIVIIFHFSFKKEVKALNTK